MALAAPSGPRRTGKTGLSLKGRALQWLAQREQSRVELRRKLMRYAVNEALVAQLGGALFRHPVSDLSDALHACGATGANGNPNVPDRSAACASATEQVEMLLDWLEANRYLSTERFIESRVNARAGRFGNLRICHELKQHQVALSDEAAQTLRDSECERAKAVRERKFGSRPEDAAERARQARFLAGRGFSPGAIGQALRDAAGREKRESSSDCRGTDGLAGADDRSG